MAGSNEVLLVRHGETDDNAAGRFQGRTDTLLNDRGREQSRALAVAVAGEGLCALYASPLLRARETAQIVGAQIGLEPIVDERLVEADTGDWSGLLTQEIVATAAGEYAAWRAVDRTFRFPGGESVVEQSARVEAALADVLAGPLPALVVCHGGTMRAIAELGLAGRSIANCEVHRLRALAVPPPR